MPEPDPADVYKGYLAHKERLGQQEFETSRDCDKWTLTAAGTALALSFTFLKDIVNLSAAHDKWLLLVAWALLVLAVGASLASLHLGEMAHRRFQDCLDKAGKEGFDGTFWSRARAFQAECWHSPLTSIASRSALGLVLAGFVGLLSFVYLNINSTGASNGQEQHTPSSAAAAAITAAKAAASEAASGAPVHQRSGGSGDAESGDKGGTSTLRPH